MPLGEPLTSQILSRVEPGPRPTEHDDTGHLYMVHDAYVRASALGPPLCAALDLALGQELPIDSAIVLNYNYQTLRPWERLTVLVRTASGLVLGTLRSKRDAEVHRFTIGELDVVRTKNIYKGETELQFRKGRPVLVLGGAVGRGSRNVELEFERVAGVNQPAAPPAISMTPPGWHPDPSGRHRLRWWDGREWTAHAADADGAVVVDPL